MTQLPSPVTASDAAEVRRVSMLRGRWLAAAYLLFGLAVFLFVLAARFPYADTISSLLAPYQLELTYQQQRMSPPFGAELDDVRLISTADPSRPTLLESEEVKLAPTLASLILGRPGLRLRAALYGGTVKAVVYRRGNETDTDFALSGLDLASIEPLRQFGAATSGTLSASGIAQFRGPDLSDQAAELTLDGSRVVAEIVRGLAPLRLNQVNGQITLNSGVLTLTDVRAQGGDVDLRADGTIQLAPDLPDSVVNVRFALHPSATARAHYGLFIKMLPHPPDQGPYALSGPLGSPSLR